MGGLQANGNAQISPLARQTSVLRAIPANILDLLLK